MPPRVVAGSSRGDDVRQPRVVAALAIGALAAALAGLLPALVPPAGARREVAKRPTPALGGAAMIRLLHRIETHRDETWRWQRVMHTHRTPFRDSARRIRSLAYRRWVVSLWRPRAEQARQRALNPPHKREWLCIHRYEGRWDDPGGPYYGGLQMDLSFQHTYGGELLQRKGTADHWTPIEQMWVAERAQRTRGFWPWPNTARYCGLL
jgi:hypothetical protein